MRTVLIRSLYVLVIGFLFGLTACKKAVSKQAKYLPKDAMFVVGINGGAIKQKLQDDAFSIDNLLSTITGNDSTINSIKEKMSAIKNSGINLEDPIYLAFRMNPEVYFHAIGVAALKSADDFESFLKKQIKNAPIQKADDINYINFEPNSKRYTVLLGWNKDVVVFTSAEKKSKGYDDYNTDTSGVSKAPSRDNATESDAVATLKKIFNQKEEESLVSIPEFKSLQREKADATLWMNTTLGITNNIPMQFPKLKSLLENYYTAATINFNNGEVVLEGKTYMSKELGEIFKKNAGASIDLSLLQKYPSNNLNGFASFSIKPEFVVTLVKALGVDGLADIGLMQMGLNFNDVVNVFKGDFMVAFSDFGMKQVQSPYDPTYTYTRPDAKWLFMVPLGEKTTVDKVMGALIQQQKMRKEGNRYIPVGMEMNSFALQIDDKQIIVTSDSMLLQQYIYGTGKTTIPADVESAVKNKVMAIYVDISKILSVIPIEKSMNGMMVEKMLDKTKNLFKDLIVTADHYDGTSMNQKWTLRLKDEKENSIKQLYKYAQMIIEFGMTYVTGFRAAEQMNDYKQPAIDTASSITKDVPVMR